MRNAFVKTVTRLGENPRTCLLISDTGQYILSEFKEKFPNRFYNIGIAEQNMIGLAAGLAKSGKIVFTYGIASFYARAIEQIKVDVCYHNLPVRIIGVGAGLAYGTMGPTHHATEDIAIMRALPNMTIISPCDPVETGKAIEAAFYHPGPVYVRLGLTGEESLHSDQYDYRLGDMDFLREGTDVAIIVTGRLAPNAMWAAKILEKINISAMVVNIHTIKPLNISGIIDIVKTFKAILTVEEHNIFGGLGSAIAEIIASHSIPIRFKRLGIIDKFCSEYGSRSYLEDRLRLSDLWIADEARALFRRDV